MKDSRKYKWYRQRKKRGFDDRETWSLDHTIAKFVIPRLKRFREIEANYPAGLTMEKWNKILDQMIYSLETVMQEFDGKTFETPENRRRVQRGLKLFGEYFRHLWW